jgi:hypothetical protein
MVANESFAPIAINGGAARSKRAPAMYTRKGMKSQKQIAWLMALGRGLRVEYDKRMQPLPPGLAALVEQFEIGEQLSTRQRKAPEEKKSSALLSLVR